jgi:acyl carrier protein
LTINFKNPGESILTTSEVYQRLSTVLQEVFDDDELEATPNLTASDVEGWDSLKHIRLVLSVEKAFHISFAASEIGNLKNIGELAGLIEAKT